MTSSKVPALRAQIERFPIAGSFTISRGAKTEAVTVVAEVSRDGLTGRGECVPYPRYGETPEATLAAIQAMAQLGEMLRVHRSGTLGAVANGSLTADAALLRVEAVRNLQALSQHAWRSAAHLVGRG